ncbi:MAG: VWA domain-containing protein [Ilumatobacteraceae bacterium]|nr:VWA domain-containing protein [Paracoccaceae bacterium]
MASSAAEELAVGFGRVLRGLGLRVPLDSVLTFTDALGSVGLDRRDPVYWAGRATLVHRPEDQPIYDRAFAVYWEQRDANVFDEPDEPETVTLAIDSDDEDDGDDGPDDSDTRDQDDQIDLRFSATEVLRHKDFSAYTSEELAVAHHLMSQLRLVGAPRRSRRFVGGAHATKRPDLRRTVRSALRSGGEPIRRHHRDPGERLRRIVLLLDVSGSMEPYARALLRFVHAAVAGRQRVEAFALGTRLTRVTRELSSRDPDRALASASGRVEDWSGGTRLGDCLRRFNDEWGVRGLARGAIVVILSDGWDRGDPEVLSEQMLRLQRVAFRTVWVNPLKVTPGYAPLARGMAAALPYVDDFVEGHSISAMEELARVISRR